MLSLVRKDLRITRLFWLPAAFSYVVFLLLAVLDPYLLVLTGVFLTMLLVATLLLIDDLSRTDPLFAGLPLRRRDIVTGRYLSGGLVIAASLGLFLAAVAGLRALLGPRAAHLGVLFTLRGVLAFLIPALILLALTLPLYFWKGLGRAALSVLGILMGVTIVVLSAVRSSPPEKPGDGTVKTGFVAELLDRSTAAVRGFVSWGEAAMGGTLFAVALVLAVIAVLYVSWKLSVRLYSRRDL
ncbi:MAG: ABC-2 transporter permease [Candidatus Aminicenantes bacterium]|nr:ABC-2 transporter permease [Candidatus Aminicenantes bacterium]